MKFYGNSYRIRNSRVEPTFLGMNKHTWQGIGLGGLFWLILIQSAMFGIERQDAALARERAEMVAQP
jgi:hypothetical protein